MRSARGAIVPKGDGLPFSRIGGPSGASLPVRAGARTAASRVKAARQAQLLARPSAWGEPRREPGSGADAGSSVERGRILGGTPAVLVLTGYTKSSLCSCAPTTALK